MATLDNNDAAPMDWIFFLVSLVITIALLIFLPAWFWVTLPFVLTYLAKALNAI
ncbi:MAG: hypothetical protein AAF798_04805 [Bacteroidota bacterium]